MENKKVRVWLVPTWRSLILFDIHEWLHCCEWSFAADWSCRVSFASSLGWLSSMGHCMCLYPAQNEATPYITNLYASGKPSSSLPLLHSFCYSNDKNKSSAKMVPDHLNCLTSRQCSDNKLKANIPCFHGLVKGKKLCKASCPSPCC